MPRTTLRFVSVLLFCLACCVASVTAHGQNISPRSQINWSNSTGCSTVGASYVPQSNSCIPFVGLLLKPTGAQTITQPSPSQPLAINYLAPMFVNGAVQAAAFCGSGTVGGITLPACSTDACHKLLAANQFAAANGHPLVDASGFTGTVACSANPFAGLKSKIGDAVFLTVRFGATHFRSTVVWEVTNSGITLDGAGPFSTQVEYTGRSCTSKPGSCAVLWVNTDAGSGDRAKQGGPNGMVIRDMSFYGDAANVYDAVILESSRSRFDNIYAWGATTCGIRMHGAEESTFTHPVVSGTAAFFLGINIPSAHTRPANGICFDEDSAQGTNSVTSTTVSDPIMEGVAGIGIDVIGGNNVVITGGTSESNGTNGMVVGAHKGVVNQQITVMGTDFEGNGNGGSTEGYDVLDNGTLDQYINILATSHCKSACSSVWLNGNGTANGDWIQGGLLGDYVHNTGVGGIATNGTPIPGFMETGTCKIDGYMVQAIKGVTAYVPYCTTLHK